MTEGKPEQESKTIEKILENEVNQRNKLASALCRTAIKGVGAYMLFGTIAVASLSLGAIDPDNSVYDIIGYSSVAAAFASFLYTVGKGLAIERKYREGRL